MCNVAGGMSSQFEVLFVKGSYLNTIIDFAVLCMLLTDV